MKQQPCFLPSTINLRHLRSIKKDCASITTTTGHGVHNHNRMTGDELMLIIVKLDLKEDADLTEVLENVDYDFKHPDIICTEIVDVITED